MYEFRVDNTHKEAGLDEIPGYGLIITACELHDNPNFAVQTTQKI